MEKLDFCRIKKIFDKGFGFLTSLHFKENIFFHFSKFNDPVIRDDLNNLKRGLYYIYYTSRPSKSGRKVAKFWWKIENVPPELLNQFTDTLMEQFNSGRMNLFELSHAVKELRQNNCVTPDQFSAIIRSGRLVKLPSVIKSMLTENELVKFQNIDEFFENIETLNIPHNQKTELILKKLNIIKAD